MGQRRYAWVTFLPMCFVAVITLSAGWQNITHNFLPLAQQPGMAFQGYLNAGLTAFLMMSAVLVLGLSIPRWCFPRPPLGGRG
jgi:carbon starvation protein CstA